MEKRPIDFEESFDIDRVSFKSVSSEFERKFRDRYEKSLSMMAGNRDPLTNAGGINSLGMLEKMAGRMRFYDEDSDFEESYNELLKEYEPFSET